MKDTYSFQEVIQTFYHPAKGVYSANGSGLGSIQVEYAGDKTVHDVAADGTIMPSYVAGHNGTVSISMQQTSDFHTWLLNLYNYLRVAPKANWALGSYTIDSLNTSEHLYLTGLSPQKPAGRPYQAQGQNVTWTFMATDISEQPV